MYYTGYDPYTGKKVYVARNIEEKRRQKEYFSRYSSKRGQVKSEAGGKKTRSVRQVRNKH
jgi:hypothetical protein